MNFEDFYWHDAIIKNIIIDRQNPGRKDEIKMEIVWTINEENEDEDGDENEYEEKVNFIFEDVYWARIDLNFGIIAKETILCASILDNDVDLSNLYQKRKGWIDDIKLNTYFIELNSTGGTLKIIAKSFRVDKLR